MLFVIAQEPKAERQKAKTSDTLILLKIRQKKSATDTNRLLFFFKAKP
jgi:hypothetical protein